MRDTAHVASTGVHTPQVAGDHYADIPALLHIHEATIAQALEEALQQTVAHILPPAEEQRLRGDPTSAPSSLVVAPEQIEALLSGEQDVWVAGCATFYASPFGKRGLACPLPVWGCLECPNAVINSRHLPAILLFLNRMVAERMHGLSSKSSRLFHPKSFLRLVPCWKRPRQSWHFHPI